MSSGIHAVSPPATPPAPISLGIVDIHHDDGSYSLTQFRAGGGLALIHKATEGKDFADRGFAAAMSLCKGASMMRGAYHFGSASAPGAVQADFFLSRTAHIDGALLVLDLENNPGSSGTMATSEGAAFAARVRTVTGRWPVLYAGASDLRTRIAKAALDVRATLAHCPLWIAQYGEMPSPKGVPSLWPNGGWSLWQYSSSTDNGPHDQRTFPRGAPGFVRRSQDVSCFRGTPGELATWWKLAGLDPVDGNASV